MIANQANDRAEADTPGADDPISRIQVAPGARPASCGAVAPHTLSPFQRALLVNDGTVTSLIEAYTLEPVAVRCVGNFRRPLDRDDPWLAAPTGCAVIERRVLLLGQRTGRLYGHAEAVLILDRLPPEVCRRLEQQGQSLGRIIGDAGLESHREILWWGWQPADSVPDEARRAGLCDRALRRAYRITVARRPVALINEWFPGTDPSCGR